VNLEESLEEVMLHARELSTNQEFLDAVSLAFACHFLENSEVDIESWVKEKMGAQLDCLWNGPSSISSPILQPPSFIKEGEKTQVYKSFSKNLPRHLREPSISVLKLPEIYSYLVDPNRDIPSTYSIALRDEINVFKRLTLRDRSIIIESLRKIAGKELFLEKEVSLRGADVDKAAMLSYLYKKNPEMFVLLLKCKTIGSFLELLRLMDGKTITFPKAEKLEDLLSGIKTGKAERFEKLLDEEYDGCDSVVLEEFARKAAASLLGASEIVEGRLEEELSGMPTTAVVRTYTLLQKMLDKVIAKGD